MHNKSPALSIGKHSNSRIPTSFWEETPFWPKMSILFPFFVRKSGFKNMAEESLKGSGKYLYYNLILKRYTPHLTIPKHSCETSVCMFAVQRKSILSGE